MDNQKVEGASLLGTVAGTLFNFLDSAFQDAIKDNDIKNKAITESVKEPPKSTEVEYKDNTVPAMQFILQVVDADPDHKSIIHGDKVNDVDVPVGQIQVTMIYPKINVDEFGEESDAESDEKMEEAKPSIKELATTVIVALVPKKNQFKQLNLKSSKLMQFKDVEKFILDQLADKGLQTLSDYIEDHKHDKEEVEENSEEAENAEESEGDVAASTNITKTRTNSPGNGAKMSITIDYIDHGEDLETIQSELYKLGLDIDKITIYDVSDMR